jgi:glycosyltransferase involved in cell wall biosynthesis
MAPKVSIVCPTFNGATRGYLREAIESALDQTFKGYELIIVDDGSTDHTKEVCEPYLEDSRVHYIFQPNAGPASARNTGISASTGEFICFLDDDDIWKAEKLQRQIEYIDAQLSNFSNWGMVFTWVELIDAQGKLIGYRGHQQTGLIYRDLFFGNIIDATSSVLVKREVLNQVGFFDEKNKQCEDWDMWLRIAKNYLIFPIQEYLVKHREHQDRLSSSSEEAFFYENAVLKKALSTAPPEINPRDVYASCYINRSIIYFSHGEYRKFRTMFIRGSRLSPKIVTIENIFLLLISFFGDRAVGIIKRTKREIHKTWIEHKVRETL